MKRVALAILTVLVAGPLSAAATIDAGTWEISQAAGRLVYVEVYTDISETARGLNFSASLANGPGDSTALLFTALEFGVSDGIYDDYMWFGANLNSNWTGSATSASGGGSKVPPEDVVIPGTQAKPAGLVRVTLDASSAPLGTWDFLLTNASGDTVWTQGSGGKPELVSGTITVTPEPAVLVQLLALLGMGGIGLFFRRRKPPAG